LLAQRGLLASCSPFGGIPRNWKRLPNPVPPLFEYNRSPFGGIPRNWKPPMAAVGGSAQARSSPFGGIPRNWKLSPINSMLTNLVF